MLFFLRGVGYVLVYIKYTLYALYLESSGRIQTDKADFHLFTGNPPLLLLPENVRIRKYNLSSEKYGDYLEEQEHIQAVDYDWDPEGIALSEYPLCICP